MSPPPRTDRPDGERGLLASLLRTLLATALVLSIVLAGVLLATPALDVTWTPDGFEEPRLPVDLGGPPADENASVDDDGAAVDSDGSTYEAESGPIRSETVERLVEAEVDDRRAEHGLDPLEHDGTVAAVSRAHSVDMAEREYFSHTNPDGEDPMDRFAAVASYCRAYGENIAMTWIDRDVRGDDGEISNHGTAEELAAGLVDGWMDSPPHREAILTERWDRGGVGVYLTDDGRAFATHNFCGLW